MSDAIQADAELVESFGFSGRVLCGLAGLQGVVVEALARVSFYSCNLQIGVAPVT